MRQWGKQDIKQVALAAAIVTLLSAVAAATPIEDFISLYPYPNHPWILYWRVALVMLFTWLLASAFASRERAFLTWLTLTSAVALAVAHYAHLLVVIARTGVEASFYPFFYKLRYMGGETLYLDIAQVVLVITIAEFYLISRKPPRTASDESRTPSH